MNTLKIVLISFLAGVIGALAFEWVKPEYVSSSGSKENNFVKVDQKYDKITETSDFVMASAISTPSVVYIKTSSTQYGQTSFFDLFFGNSSPQQVLSSGSGVIYTADGYIITNNHVIDNATAVEVVHNKRTYKAKIVGTDPSTDLAVLKIEGKNLPGAKIGSSKAVQIGEWVLAVGNPFNLNSTVTAGIVSAKDRNININTSQFPIESFIQTDAAINPGNSGGALVNTKGELIGINTAILSKTGSYTGYGFAVPIDIVTKVVKDLIQYGEVQKAFLGLEVADIDEKSVSQYELSDYNGVVITYLDVNGSVQKAGLKKGDVILKVNNESINSKGAFDEQVSFYRPGDKVTITYRRGNQQNQAQISLTNIEGTTGVLKRETFTVEGLGADLETVSQIERNRLKINGGVRIARVKSGLIGNLGIEEGFIITSVNKQVITTPKEVADLLSKTSGRVIIEGVDKHGQEAYYQFYNR